MITLRPRDPAMSNSRYHPTSWRTVSNIAEKIEKNYSMRNRRLGEWRKFRIHSADEKPFLLIDISALDSTQHCAYLKYHISCWRRLWFFLDSSQHCGLFGFFSPSSIRNYCAAFGEEWKSILDLLWSRRIKWGQRICRQGWSKKVFSSRWFSRFNGGKFSSSTCAIFGVCFFGRWWKILIWTRFVLMLHEISHRLIRKYCFVFVDSQNSKLETHSTISQFQTPICA